MDDHRVIRMGTLRFPKGKEHDANWAWEHGYPWVGVDLGEEAPVNSMALFYDHEAVVVHTSLVGTSINISIHPNTKDIEDEVARLRKAMHNIISTTSRPVDINALKASELYGVRVEVRALAQAAIKGGE